MTLSFFITVIPDHDKPQPPGCLLDPRKVIRRREGQDAARDLQGVGGEPPAVTAPLEQVQI
ncbi:hypothetical protein, partial [Escherichia coli]|uniref:hypothetical protein n=1 Tax=Escherichia coli TaxID=562 RepID=UPI00390463A7